MDDGWQSEEEIAAPPPSRYNDRYGGDNRGPPRSRNNDNDRGNDGGGRYGDRNDSVVLEINPNKVGMVIGRGGAKIREIQEQYNVNVKVGKNCVFQIELQCQWFNFSSLYTTQIETVMQMAYLV